MVDVYDILRREAMDFGRLDVASDPVEILEREEERKRLYTRLELLLDFLTPRQKEALSMRYSVGYEKAYTFQEIAEKLGISRARAQQLVKKCMWKLVGMF